MTANDGDDAPLLSEPAVPVYGGLEGAPPQPSFKRNLGTAEAFSIIISIVIGSGIFTSPGAIDSNVPSPGAALIVWLAGGVLAWTGAATMAELGTAIPGEGQYMTQPPSYFSSNTWLTLLQEESNLISSTSLVMCSGFSPHGPGSLPSCRPPWRSRVSCLSRASTRPSE